TLTLKNAISTGSTVPTYTFQVASDAAFGTVVSTNSNVPAGANGQTSVTLGKLGGGATYFWRAQTSTGNQGGPFTKSRSFVVGPQIVLGTPTIASPANGGTITGTTASVTVNNVSKTGPVSQVSYKLEVADSSSFGHIVFTTTVPEQGGQTNIQVNATLSSGTTYYARVTAIESPSGITSQVSSVTAFSYIAFTMSQAIIVDNPPDLASWEQTATITSIQFANDAMEVDFDKRDGPRRWADSPFGRPGDSVEYTLGMCLNINGQWFCSAPIQFWYGRDLDASGHPEEVGRNWFYPPAWGPMSGYQPQWGEMVGFFTASGSLRHDTDGSGSIQHERSNVVLLPFGSNYTLGGGVTNTARTSRGATTPRVTIRKR
ncbi:MAG TPA: hypothetical protein VNZ26_32690, partial [Vicinamibacterales bacterium]|nr:hypothetical protein [Vicinamibacterales bacterium]